MPEFSDAQVIAAICAALKARDMRAVVDLLHVLAVQNPREASIIMDAILVQARFDQIGVRVTTELTEATKPSQPGAVFVCPSDHQHGANSTCWSRHRCRCGGCRQFMYRYNRDRYRAIAYGPHHPFVPAVGVHRRLQALAYQGWSMKQLATRLGVTNQVMHQTLRRTKVTPETWEKISDLFAELWDQDPNPADGYEAGWVERTKRKARSRGWVPALAWDDIDNPYETPDCGGTTPTDEVDDNNVQDAVDGLKPVLTQAERRVVVARLHTRGWADLRIADHTGMSDRTVLRIRGELGLDAWPDSVTKNWKAYAA